jgi:hypothetical protein
MPADGGEGMSSAQIIQLFRAAAFDPDSIERLGFAYDLATARLHDRDRRPAMVNEIIAQRIIAFAQGGERDPKTLADSALKALGFDRA